MSRDTFILIAFVAFVFLAGRRIRQRWTESKLSPRGRINNHPETLGEEVEADKFGNSKRLRKRLRRIFSILQLLVLGGLILYMIPALIRDFSMSGRMEAQGLILRCLIFVFTIYIFISGFIRYFGHKHKENAGK